jgi:hypothetical protein
MAAAEQAQLARHLAQAVRAQVLDELVQSDNVSMKEQ